tara:strand:+ start:754 stop:1284 length:531 start_codon:yes stop_codon:yes gene_type:complete
MSNEIERKWVLKKGVKPSDIKSMIESDKEDSFEQFYLAEKDNTVRVRIVNDTHAILCFKGKPSDDGLSRIEIEEDIDVDFAEKLRQLSIGGLEKDRTVVMDKETGLEMEFDFYKGNLEGLVTVEIEYPSLEAVKESKIPEIVDSLFVEVTGKREYSNDQLAKFGLPKENKSSNKYC